MTRTVAAGWRSGSPTAAARSNPAAAVSRYISAGACPKHDSDTQFDAAYPATAAFDPVADEHVLTTFSGYSSTGRVRRFSPMGVLTGGSWTLEPGAMLPTVALDPRTGGG